MEKKQNKFKKYRHMKFKKQVKKKTSLKNNIKNKKGVFTNETFIIILLKLKLLNKKNTWNKLVKNKLLPTLIIKIYVSFCSSLGTNSFLLA